MLDEAILAASVSAVEPFAADPATVSPVLGSMARTWHDALSEGEREALLRPRLPKLIGTRAEPAVEERRAILVADWLARCFLPNWLHAAGLVAQADKLAGAPEFTSLPALLLLGPSVERAAQDAHAAWLAARSLVKAEVPPEVWRTVLEDVRNTVREVAHLNAEASVRTPIEDLDWSKVEFTIWAAVEASIWAVAWTGLRVSRADGVRARVTAALTPLSTALVGTAMTLLERMAALIEATPPLVGQIKGAVLYGYDDLVSAWVQERIPEMAGRSFGPCGTLGILRGNRLVGGVVYNLFRPHPDGGDITVNAAFEPDCRISPATLRQMFRYPFVQLGCARLSDFVIRSNKPARRFAERTGFKLEGVRRRGHGREDVFTYGMLRSECRYLDERP